MFCIKNFIKKHSGKFITPVFVIVIGLFLTNVFNINAQVTEELGWYFKLANQINGNPKPDVYLPSLIINPDVEKYHYSNQTPSLYPKLFIDSYRVVIGTQRPDTLNGILFGIVSSPFTTNKADQTFGGFLLPSMTTQTKQQIFDVNRPNLILRPATMIYNSDLGQIQYINNQTKWTQIVNEDDIVKRVNTRIISSAGLLPENISLTPNTRDDTLKFFTNNQEAMRINHQGKVSIGATTMPNNATLYVKGLLRADAATFITSSFDTLRIPNYKTSFTQQNYDTGIIFLNPYSGQIFTAQPVLHKIETLPLKSFVYTIAGNKLNIANTTPSFPVDKHNAIMGSISGIVVDKQENIYACDSARHVIYKIAIDGYVSIFAGTLNTPGDQDGLAETNDPHSKAKFNKPIDITIDNDGNLFVSDQDNNKIKKININDKSVTTFAGGGNDDANPNNINPLQASFDKPAGVYLDIITGDLYVTEPLASVVRKISKDGKVTTVVEQDEKQDIN